MKQLLGLMLFIVSELVIAADTCEYHDTKLAVGESVWVLDPVLVERYTQSRSLKGVSPSDIKDEVSKHDWLGYRIVCVYTITPGALTDTAGSIIRQNGVALVLNKYSQDFYESVLAYKKTSEDEVDP